jgi:hypothetical protein
MPHGFLTRREFTLEHLGEPQEPPGDQWDVYDRQQPSAHRHFHTRLATSLASQDGVNAQPVSGIYP